MTDSAKSPRRLALLAVALLLVGAITAALVWPRADEPPPPKAPPPTQPEPDPEPGSPPVDPRTAFATEFRNVRPDVKYVGDAVCGRCHDTIAQTYHEHPMGRSAEWRPGAVVDHTAGSRASFAASGYSLSVVGKEDGFWHTVGLANGAAGDPVYEVPVHLAIGSGSRGRSYLTVDRGAVWQTPISWFGQRQRWDVSPGFDLAKEMRRPIVSRCLGCHTDRPEPVPDSINRYREPLFAAQASIGCERCHGPGELHVAERSRGATPDADTSIVNPARLPADLKADVCRQCHLQGAVQISRRGRDPIEYRPGLPLEQFVTTFLWHPDLTDSRKSVGQFEQMESSRCFTASAGKMGCTSCHDPHKKPAPHFADEYFRLLCLSCHQTRGCSLPKPQREANNDSCVSCHMPARDSSNVAHVAVTDHRIMKRPDAGGVRAKVLAPGQQPLVAYRPGPYAPSAAERERDLAIALGNEMARTGAAPDRWRQLDARLDRVLRRGPDDGPAWLTRSRSYTARGEGERAIEAARAAVALNPESEVALGQLAAAALAAEEYELVIRTAQKLIALSPSSADHLVTRATAYFSLKDWARAQDDCRAALAIQPVRPNVRFMLAVCLHKGGDAGAGRRELDLVLKLTPTPEVRAKLTDWYGQLTR